MGGDWRLRGSQVCRKCQDQSKKAGGSLESARKRRELLLSFTRHSAQARAQQCAPEVEVLEGEADLDNASGLDARAQDVLLGGHVVLLADALQRVQEAARMRRIC